VGLGPLTALMGCVPSATGRYANWSFASALVGLQLLVASALETLGTVQNRSLPRFASRLGIVLNQQRGDFTRYEMSLVISHHLTGSLPR